MSQKAKKLIEIQKKICEEAVVKRQAELRNRKLEDEKILKDPLLKHLRAKLRQANRRLLAIAHIEKQMDAAALRKAERHMTKLEGGKPLKRRAKKPATQSKVREEEEGIPITTEDHERVI